MKQAVRLARTFFGRFFESDLLPPGMPQAQVVIWSLAFLATPGLLLPVRFASSNLKNNMEPERIAQNLLVLRLFFITLTMTAIGVVALVIWDGIFPDRRDARILTPLPVPGSVLIGARLLALGALCGVFLVGINLVPTALFAPTITVFGGADNMVQGVLAHVVSNGLAGLFVFCSLISLQGLALNLGGKRASDRMSLLLQVLFVAALLQLIFFMTRVGAMLPRDLDSGWLRAMPTVWFLGLNDVIGGRPAKGAPMLAIAALCATAATAGGAILMFVATHARLTRRALESRATEGRRTAFVLVAYLTRGFARHPVTRAVLRFTLHSLARSRSHRLLMAMYAGGALALVASAIVPTALSDGLAVFTTPRIELLSAPLVLQFLLLVGMRVAVAIPIEPAANWVFRLAEPTDRPAAVRGVQVALLVAGVAPTTLVAAATAGALWGAWPAIVHAIVCAMMGYLLVEVLMIRFAKLPFTCSYMPGSSRVGTLWPLYLTAFITYSYTIAAWELRFFRQPVALGVFVLVIGGAIAVLTLRRHYYSAAFPVFRFQEEDPTALFAGFNLSEGFAAATPDIRKAR
jgi:hypothetical protein